MAKTIFQNNMKGFHKMSPKDSVPTRWQPKKLSNFANFELAGNFERSLAARTWMASASNFANVLFRRFPTFGLSIPKTQNCLICWQTFRYLLTSRGWLCSGWNFAKTRFRRFPTFQSSILRKKWGRIMASKIWCRPIILAKTYLCWPKHLYDSAKTH